MLKPSIYIILTAFLITLEIYRIQTPLGLTVAFYHIFLGLALFMGILSFLSGRLRIKIERDTKSLLLILLLFASYSFLSFVRNISIIMHESMSTYFAELVGYSMVLAIPFLIIKISELKKLTNAFLASAFFVYIGSFWHIYNFVILGQYVIGTPFWGEYTKSEHVMTYLYAQAHFEGFPRFRLPFSSPAGTGLFLSLTGILLLAHTLHHIANRKKRSWILILLNLLNFFCLLGTFARASWVVFGVGSLFTLWCFMKLNLIKFGRLSLISIAVAGFFYILLSLTPIGDEFFYMISLRLTPGYTETSDIGHLESRLLALEYWTESPLIGLGIGGFFQKPGGGIHTHSTYFTILVDRGFVGLILFLIFLFQLYRTLRRKIPGSWECADEMMLTYNIGFLGILIGLFIGMFLYEMSSETVWMLFGIMLAFVKLLSSKKTTNEQRLALRK